MNYIKLKEDGTVVYPYGLGDLRRDHPHTSFPSDLTGVDLSEFGVMDISSARDLPDEVTQASLLSAAKTELLSRLAAVRWAKETGGITISGATINTDRESQALVNGALALVTANRTILIDWKGASGWVQLDAATVQGIAYSVGSHVQACFSRERTLAEQIQAATDFDTLDGIDITVGWP